MVSKELLELLCCPVCKGRVQMNPSNDALVCQSCGKSYRVEDDIPVMIPDDRPSK